MATSGRVRSPLYTLLVFSSFLFLSSALDYKYTLLSLNLVFRCPPSNCFLDYSLCLSRSIAVSLTYFGHFLSFLVYFRFSVIRF